MDIMTSTMTSDVDGEPMGVGMEKLLELDHFQSSDNSLFGGGLNGTAGGFENVFFKDFVCCEMNFLSLHELLQHYENVHVNVGGKLESILEEDQESPPPNSHPSAPSSTTSAISEAGISMVPACTAPSSTSSATPVSSPSLGFSSPSPPLMPMPVAMPMAVMPSLEMQARADLAVAARDVIGIQDRLHHMHIDPNMFLFDDGDDLGGQGGLVGVDLVQHPSECAVAMDPGPMIKREVGPVEGAGLRPSTPKPNRTPTPSPPASSRRTPTPSTDKRSQKAKGPIEFQQMQSTLYFPNKRQRTAPVAPQLKRTRSQDGLNIAPAAEFQQDLHMYQQQQQLQQQLQQQQQQQQQQQDQNHYSQNPMMWQPDLLLPFQPAAPTPQHHIPFLDSLSPFSPFSSERNMHFGPPRPASTPAMGVFQINNPPPQPQDFGVVWDPLTGKAAAAAGLGRTGSPANGEERKFKCPKPYCSKVYKNSNGLKYHLERGNCELDAADVAPHSHSDCESDSSSIHHPSSSTSTATPSISADGVLPADVKIAHRPYWCHVKDCRKKYKNLNGLKYHARVAHPGKDFGREVKGVM
ncbi:hypothetical protein HK104_008898 [Borealophlyctis nickersoniae]|nr:hypothetical protein HK104_008898 [Borealophlyctis nickersoniae]